MRILLVMPDSHMHSIHLGPFVRSFREMPLTLCTLAALTPDLPDLDIKLVDGSVEPVPMNDSADLVGISVITGCAPSAYAIADHYRGRGVPVVLGGIHVTILPGEAARHADAIVIGRGETTWPKLVRDFVEGRMKGVYREEPADGEWLEGVPSPRRELHRRGAYVLPDSIQATRGCKRACDFCTVPAVWSKYMKRPIGDVLRDIEDTRGKHIAFNDVSLLEDIDYAKELFEAMIPLKKKWGGLATVDSVKDPELLDLMARSGCAYLLFGFESGNGTVLKGIRKGFNRVDGYQELVKTIHGLGISVQGCFVFGFDEDEPSVFPATVEKVNELEIDIPRYSIYTPYPGTQLFQRLLSEGRILSFNWNDYDTMHVVMQPARMTPEELYDGFKRAYRETFKMSPILNRMRGAGIGTAINLVGNVAYRLFVRRLYHEPRYSRPFSSSDPGRPPEAADYRAGFCRRMECPA